jgi:hypothetical protein
MDKLLVIIRAARVLQVVDFCLCAKTPVRRQLRRKGKNNAAFQRPVAEAVLTTAGGQTSVGGVYPAIIASATQDSELVHITTVAKLASSLPPTRSV